jgi:hypothetical protein
MVTDRGRSYEAEKLLAVKQQKCLDHLNRNINEVPETKTGQARWLSQEMFDQIARAPTPAAQYVARYSHPVRSYLWEAWRRLLASVRRFPVRFGRQAHSVGPPDFEADVLP